MKWTPELLSELKREYPNRTNAELAEIFGCSVSSVKNKAVRLGIKKSVSHRNEGRFKKGLPAWNRGVKGCMKANKTSFKKGNRPHNSKKDGDISVRADGYAWIRISDANWMLYHRYLYEQHYKITLSTEDNIVFKNGDRFDFRVDNLERISNKELANRNSIQRFPAEIRGAIRAVSSLKKAIKNYEKQD